MPPIPGMVHWHSLIARHAKSIRTAFNRAAQAVEAQLTGKTPAQLEPILIRQTPKQPLHPLARLRQGQNRWYSTARRSLDSVARHFSTESGARAGSKFDKSSWPTSRVGTYVQQSSGRAPFASTLRPNLTGGTLGRTAGGYSLGGGRIGGGGARYFSHSPASQAQVVQNVSQAVRAFFVSGQKAQFDGVNPRGEKKFRAVSALQEETGRKVNTLHTATPGSVVEFHINPTITALTPLGAIVGSGFSSTASQNDHLNSDGLLDVLSVDFSRTLKDLAAVLNDLKRLSALGDLPLTHEGSYLRVHFPGCDAATVEALCQELNVTRGTIVQDEDFDAFVGTEIALLFPFSPSDEESDAGSLFESPALRTPAKQHVIDLAELLSPDRSPAFSTRSDHSTQSFDEEAVMVDPWLSSPSGFVTAHSASTASLSDVPLEYQGFEGIYRFIEELDARGART